MTEQTGVSVPATEKAVEKVAEYCFLYVEHWSTCMTKSEWASWAQALGSILALAVSLAVGWYAARAAWSQQKHEWAMRRLEVCELTITRIEIAQMMVQAAFDEIDQFIKSASPLHSRAIEQLNRCAALLEDALISTPGHEEVHACKAVLDQVAAIREVAISWSDPAVVRGGSCYELLKRQVGSVLSVALGQLADRAASLRRNVEPD